MELDAYRVKQPDVPITALEYSSFGIQPPKDLDGVTWYELEESLYYSINVTSFSSHALRYRYTRPRHDPFKRLRQILKRHILAQILYLMPKHDRQQLVRSDYPKEFDPESSKFEHPEGWSYRDHVLPDLWERLRLDRAASHV